MSAAKLTSLNTFRAGEGLKPIARWHVRYTDQLAAYEAAAVKHALKLNDQPKALPAAADAMRPVNEALGQDIKAARAAWKASGATMTKKECVIELMLDVGGCSVKDIVDALGVTTTAARSLIGDVRRMAGYTVAFADGKYTVALPPQESEEDSDESDE